MVVNACVRSRIVHPFMASSKFRCQCTHSRQFLIYNILRSKYLKFTNLKKYYIKLKAGRYIFYILENKYSNFLV